MEEWQRINTAQKEVESHYDLLKHVADNYFNQNSSFQWPDQFSQVSGSTHFDDS